MRPDIRVIEEYTKILGITVYKSVKYRVIDIYGSTYNMSDLESAMKLYCYLNRQVGGKVDTVAGKFVLDRAREDTCVMSRKRADGKFETQYWKNPNFTLITDNQIDVGDKVMIIDERRVDSDSPYDISRTRIVIKNPFK